MLEAVAITKSYTINNSEYVVLDNISLCVKQGETISLMGKSGSGKSTLMHILAGIDSPTSGSILFNAEDITRFSDSKLAKFRSNEIGFVLQQSFFEMNHTCLENVLLPLYIKNGLHKDIQESGLYYLNQVGLLSKKNFKVKNLSGGEKQKLNIARALISNPKIIFADEPTGSLDTKSGREIIDLLFYLHQREKNVLFIITHDKDLALLCEKMFYLQDGKII